MGKRQSRCRRVYPAAIAMVLMSSIEVALSNSVGSDTRPHSIFFHDEVSSWGDYGVRPEPRIVNGEEPEMGRYPYLASLMTADSFHKCGGALVARDVVLTAAHCPEISSVVLGQHDRRISTAASERFEVTDTVAHPRYDFSSQDMSYDLKLVKLGDGGTSRISKREFLRLNKWGTVPVPGEALTVMGWGVVSVLKKETSPILKATTTNYVPNDICARSKGTFTIGDFNYVSSYTDRIGPSMLCAKGRGTGACDGDSGGPLIIKGETPSDDIVVGVVSFGADCANDVFPGVYARVSDQYEWIRTTACKMTDYPTIELCPTDIRTKWSDDEQPISVAPVTISPTAAPTMAPSSVLVDSSISHNWIWSLIFIAISVAMTFILVGILYCRMVRRDGGRGGGSGESVQISEGQGRKVRCWWIKSIMQNQSRLGTKAMLGTDDADEEMGDPQLGGKHRRQVLSNTKNGHPLLQGANLTSAHMFRSSTSAPSFSCPSPTATLVSCPSTELDESSDDSSESSE